MQIEHLSADLRRLVGTENLVLPGQSGYESQRLVWNGMIDRRPAAIVRPGTAEQVAGLVRLARGTGLPLAVRGGGHSFPGFSTCDGGIVLDLSRLNRVAVNMQEMFVDVAGGALLGDMDRATVPLGLVTPAGAVSHTGAGGLTLGGGMGWISRRLGLSIDNPLLAEIVTANGDIVEVTQASDPELFWGLRGGGGNFGIVTRFRFRLHLLGPVCVGKWVYPANRSVEALERLASLAAQAPRSQTTVLTVVADGLVVTAFHSGPDGLGKESVMPFGSLAGSGDGGIQDMDYLALQSRSDEGARWGRRYYARGGFLATPSGAAAETMADILRNPPSPDVELYMIQLGGAVADVAEEATAYSGRKGGFYWIVMPIWDRPEDDAACLHWGRAGGARMAALSQAGNYLNEQGEVSRELTEAAFGQSKYARLTRLKTRMDPGNLFRLNQNIQPAGPA